MQKFSFAILSATDRHSVVSTLIVHAKDMKEAMKRVRNDPDMEGVHFHPVSDKTAYIVPQELVA